MFEAVVTQGNNILVAVVALLPLVFLIFKRFKASAFQPVPPGPRPFPLLGNVHQLGKMPHRALAGFAKTYGPLFSIKLGSQRVIVASSPAAAKEILKTNDRVLSGRRRPHGLPIKNSKAQNGSFGWEPECSEYWKYMNRFLRAELLSGKALMETQACLREKNSMEMVRMIRGMECKAVNIAEVAFVTVFNTMSNILVSRDMVELCGDADISKEEVWVLMSALTEAIFSPNIFDLYPGLAGLDLLGVQKKSAKLIKKFYSLWQTKVKERREPTGIHVPRERDLLDALIEENFTTDQIDEIFLELLTAGTGSSTETIHWLMAELIKNPEAMKKLQEEIAGEVKHGVLKESQVSRLPYLQACVKEVLRLHPLAPLLIPRRAIETCQVMNYTVPRDSTVIVNVWAIGQDPANWDDPTAFKPERFLNSQVDFRGNDFEFLPFGGGRRMCPGLPLAAKQVPIVVASLVHFFDWSLPEGNDPRKLDMTEKFGLVLQKEQPLLLVPKARI